MSRGLCESSQQTGPFLPKANGELGAEGGGQQEDLPHLPPSFSSLESGAVKGGLRGLHPLPPRSSLGMHLSLTWGGGECFPW